MTRADPGGDTASRLALASEQFSILAHELAIVVQAGNGNREAAVFESPALPDAFGRILNSVSSRLSSQSLALAEIAFAAAEDSVAASGDPRAERSAAALGRAARVVEPVFEIAGELAAHLLTCYRSTRCLGRTFESASLTCLDEPIQRLLNQNAQLATGAGVAISPGVLADEHLWLQWWVNARGTSTQLLPQLKPEQAQFYDYTEAVWFAEPARELSPHLAPPHFDAGGTDQFMVTATVPVVVDDAMIGLACAELTLERVDELVGPALAALPAPAALITPDMVVVASAHPDLPAGNKVPAELLERGRDLGHASFVEPTPGVTLARSPTLAWWLLTDWRGVAPR